VSELLPRPFAELTLDDVAAIIESIGEERGFTLPTQSPIELRAPLIVRLDTTFDADDTDSRVFAEIFRAVGVGPD
jgi:hypothetical protein